MKLHGHVRGQNLASLVCPTHLHYCQVAYTCISHGYFTCTINMIVILDLIISESECNDCKKHWVSRQGISDDEMLLILV